jgi:hypothetical protein
MCCYVSLLDKQAQHARQAKISEDCIHIYNDPRIRKHGEEDGAKKRRKLNLGWDRAC